MLFSPAIPAGLSCLEHRESGVVFRGSLLDREFLALPCAAGSSAVFLGLGLSTGLIEIPITNFMTFLYFAWYRPCPLDLPSSQLAVDSSPVPILQVPLARLFNPEAPFIAPSTFPLRGFSRRFRFFAYGHSGSGRQCQPLLRLSPENGQYERLLWRYPAHLRCKFIRPANIAMKVFP